MSIENMKVGELIALVDTLRGQQSQDGPHRAAPLDHGHAVVILDRGFVYVGHVVTDADWCIISPASNLRYWGTTNGLGQLVLEGPTDKTRIDPAGTVRAPMRAVIAVLPTKEELWTKS